MKLIIKVLLCLLMYSTSSYAQGWIGCDYMTSSSLRDEAGGQYGSGDLLIMSGGYNLPFAVKQTEKGLVRAWSVTLYGKLGVLGNRGEAKNLNPDNLLNTGLNLSHIRPLSGKWSIIASLGAGVYAPLNNITTRSLLANGGVVFIYNLKKNLDLGFGAGLTNSYGIPMILPMLYFSWQQTGKYELKVDMSSGMKVSAATWLTPKVKIELTAIEMDGMSAVMNIEEKSKIYSMVMLKSYISPSYYINKRTSIYFGIGGNWVRGISITDRSLKGFINSFKDNKGDREFGVSLRFISGIRYGF